MAFSARKASFAFRLGIALAISGAIAACEPSSSVQGPAHPAHEQAKKPAKDSAKPTPVNADALGDIEAESNLLVDEGEDLVAPETLLQANTKFEEALKKDPNNIRAEFWVHVLKPYLEAGGILARIKPLYETTPDGLRRYREFVERVLQASPRGFRSYFTTGRGDIRTVDELQEWIDRFVLRLSELREYLKKHKDQQITVRASAEFIGFRVAEAIAGRHLENVEACESTSFGPIKSSLSNCGQKVQVTLNRADFEAIQQTIAIREAVILTINSYRLNPLLVLKIHGPTHQMSDIAKLVAEGGPRLRDQRWKSENIREMTKDMASAYEYVISHQSELCPFGGETTRNRPGHFMSWGRCLNYQSSGQSEEQRILSALEAAVLGQPVTNWMVNAVNDQEWSVDPFKFLDQPLTDLSVLLPAKIDRCGVITEMNDDALRPYFVTGRLDNHLYVARRLSRESCERQVPPAGFYPGTTQPSNDSNSTMQRLGEGQ